MSGAALEFVRTNPLVSVQDDGRRGAMRVGVSESGPMDWARHLLALHLVGEPVGSPTVEIGLVGLGVRSGGRNAVRLALTGPGFWGRIGDRRFEAPATLTLAPGETLDVSAGQSGLWGYLAVAGADWGPPTLGSHATNVRTGLGARDFTQPLLAAAAASTLEPVEWLDPLTDGPVALLPGPQHHLFSAQAHDAFAAEPYRVTPQIDRMGYRLEGAALVAPGGHDIISDGIVEGAVQVPGNGQPIVLMADRAPTGGYPKIAIVAKVDRPRLAQSRPSSMVGFVWQTPERAAHRRRALTARLQEPEPRRRSDFSSEFLAQRNLIGGIWPPKTDPA